MGIDARVYKSWREDVSWLKNQNYKDNCLGNGTDQNKFSKEFFHKRKYVQDILS